MTEDDDSAPYYVYVVATVDGDGISGPVKVGITSDTASRLASLRTSSAKPLELFYALGMRTRLEALGVERAFHLSQDRRRLQGEWFDMQPLKAVKLLMLGYVLNGSGSQRVTLSRWQALGVRFSDDLENDMLALLDEA